MIDARDERIKAADMVPGLEIVETIGDEVVARHPVSCHTAPLAMQRRLLREAPNATPESACDCVMAQAAMLDEDGQRTEIGIVGIAVYEMGLCGWAITGNVASGIMNGFDGTDKPYGAETDTITAVQYRSGYRLGSACREVWQAAQGQA